MSLVSPLVGAPEFFLPWWLYSSELERRKLGGLNSCDLGEAGIPAETSHPST